MKILVTEAQLRLLMEDYYDPDKLYLKSYIIDRLDKAPKYIKNSERVWIPLKRTTLKQVSQKLIQRFHNNCGNICLVIFK